MGRVGDINNCHQLIAVNRGPGQMKHELVITATYCLLGCNSMVEKIIDFQVLGSIIINIVPAEAPYGLVEPRSANNFGL